MNLWHIYLQLFLCKHICIMHACMLSLFSRVQLFVRLWMQPTRLLCPWDSPGKNTGVGCHAFLQGDLPNPGIKPRSLRSPSLASRFFGCFFFFFYHLCHLRSIYINIYIYIHTHIYIIPMLISSIYIYSQLCPLKRPSSNDNPIAAKTSVTQSGGGNVQDHHDIFSYQKVF